MCGTDVGYAATDRGCTATDLGYAANDQGYNATDLGYNATDPGMLLPASALVALTASTVQVTYLPTRALSPYARPTPCPVLTASGTDTASGAISLRVSYAMSGTDIAYGALFPPYAIRCPVLTCRVVLSAYGRAMRCPVLTWPIPTRALCDVRY
eukprot:998155-Rhodomonas_salina.5